MVAETKLYDSLNIKEDASQEDIKKAYRFVLPFPEVPCSQNVCG
jgi:hypothetical protein